MQRQIVLSILLLTTIVTAGQDINGIWKGRLVMEPGGCFPVYNMELQIQVTGSKIKGTSYHYSDTSNYVKESFEGIPLKFEVKRYETKLVTQTDLFGRPVNPQIRV